MILKIVKAPNSRLKKVCITADPGNTSQRAFARSLVETMKSHKAYGLAANQVEKTQTVRIIAISTSEFTGPMFNPEITRSAGELIKEKEACLSLTEEYAVPRLSEVEVSFRTISGEAKTITFKGFSAIVVQHEIDHINGILASDYFDNSVLGS